MKLLGPRLIVVHLLAVGSRPKVRQTWIIDGNNLMGHKGTPRDPDALTAQLRDVAADEVILVLDGRPDTETEIVTEFDSGNNSSNSNFQRVNLGQGLSADEWILAALRERNRPNARRRDQAARIRVVTADRRLRRSVRAIKPAVRGVVNPVTFWRRYRPRLCGYKKLLLDGSSSSGRNEEESNNDDDNNNNQEALTELLQEQEQQQ